MTPVSVAVAGCGTGGLAAALFLQRAGHHVTLYERFSCPAPIGSGLMIQPSGLAILDDLGLGTALRECAAPIKGLHGRAMPSGRLALSMRYAALDASMLGYGVHRSLLFRLLFDAVTTAGIEIVTDHDVVATTLLSGGRRHLNFANGTASAPFDLVVDAMGSRSALSTQSHTLPYGALWATLDAIDIPDGRPDVLDQRYRAARQMAGILPLGRSSPSGRASVAWFWSLRAADLEAWRARGLAPWRAEVRALWPEADALVDQISDPDQCVFATYQHRTLRNPIATGLVHLGDAWHATSPQLGQGANMALLDAAALGWAMETAPSIDDALLRYRRARQRHVRLYQQLSRIFTPVFQSDGLILPALRDHLMAPFDRIPLFRRTTARLVAGLAVRPLPSHMLSMK